MSVLLLDSIVDKHAIDIENDYLKMVKVRIILLPVLVWHTLMTIFNQLPLSFVKDSAWQYG